MGWVGVAMIWVGACSNINSLKYSFFCERHNMVEWFCKVLPGQSPDVPTGRLGILPFSFNGRKDGSWIE